MPIDYHEFDPALNSKLIGVIASYIPITDDPFYELFPDAYKLRLKQDYKYDTGTIDDLRHTIDDNYPVLKFENMLVWVQWFRHGRLHRDGGPASILIEISDGPPWAGARYYQYGLQHRLDGPAWVGYFQFYYIYGFHCEHPSDVNIDYCDFEYKTIPSNIMAIIDTRHPGFINSLQHIVKNLLNDEETEKTMNGIKKWGVDIAEFFRKGVNTSKNASIMHVMTQFEQALQMWKKYQPPIA